MQSPLAPLWDFLCVTALANPLVHNVYFEGMHSLFLNSFFSSSVSLHCIASFDPLFSPAFSNALCLLQMHFVLVLIVLFFKSSTTTPPPYSSSALCYTFLSTVFSSSISSCVCPTGYRHSKTQWYIHWFCLMLLFANYREQFKFYYFLEVFVFLLLLLWASFTNFSYFLYFCEYEPFFLWVHFPYAVPCFRKCCRSFLWKSSFISYMAGKGTQYIMRRNLFLTSVHGKSNEFCGLNSLKER